MGTNLNRPEHRPLTSIAAFIEQMISHHQMGVMMAFNGSDPTASTRTNAQLQQGPCCGCRAMKIQQMFPVVSQLVRKA